ncbi:hypothetical protein N7488_003194 [Penicillium malachiteum]|nr:hypothetical protein N7488_003194 [Penicillium malachiteum]
MQQWVYMNPSISPQIPPWPTGGLNTAYARRESSKDETIAKNLRNAKQTCVEDTLAAPSQTQIPMLDQVYPWGLIVF